MEETLIENIKARMAELGWNAMGLASRAGVAFPYLYRVLKGEQSPTLEYLAKISAPLGLNLVVKRGR